MPAPVSIGGAVQTLCSGRGFAPPRALLATRGGGTGNRSLLYGAKHALEALPKAGVEAPGIEPRDTSVPIVAKRREDDADRATQDDSRRREVSASTPMSPDEAIRVAAKLAIDAGDLTRARALLDLLDVERRRLARRNSCAEEIALIAEPRSNHLARYRHGNTAWYAWLRVIRGNR